MKKTIFTILILLFATCIFAQNLDMCVLDVGQGSCVVFITPDKKVMVFDCGTSSSKDYNFNKQIFQRVCFPYLKSKGVNKIDLLVLSHPHTDHYSGFFELLDNMKVDSYLKSGYSSNMASYNDLMNSFSKKHMKVITAVNGRQFKLGKKVKGTIFAPIRNVRFIDGNSNSIVLKLEYKSTSFLLTGDATKETEEFLVAKYGNSLDSDVLVAGHHGSKDASSTIFLNKVKPKVSIISCGFHNKYSNPNKETLSRLNRVNSRIYRTDLDGAVTISSDGKKIIIKKIKKQRNIKLKYKINV